MAPQPRDVISTLSELQGRMMLLEDRVTGLISDYKTRSTSDSDSRVHTATVQNDLEHLQGSFMAHEQECRRIKVALEEQIKELQITAAVWGKLIASLVVIGNLIVGPIIVYLIDRFVKH